MVLHLFKKGEQMKLKIIFPLLIFILLASNVYAAPQTTYQFDQSTYRPGTSGTITVQVFNNEGTAERNFDICFTQTQYIIPTQCGSIPYLNGGEKGTTAINFNILNEAPTPSTYPIKIYLNYQWNSVLGFLSASTNINPSVSVSGISIKDEANQKLPQAGTAISSAQNSISTAQTSITTAQNLITTAQQQNKDTSTASSDVSSAQSSISSAQTYFSNSQNEYSQAQTYYTATSYQDSLNTVNQALTDANNAASYANGANQAALQAQTAATNAGCISGYTLQGSQCIVAQQSTPITLNINNPSNQNNPNTNTQGSSNTESNSQSSSILWIIFILLIIGVVYFISKKKPKQESKKHKSKSKKQ